MSILLRKTLMSRLAVELARAAHEATDLEVVDLGDDSDRTAINACASSMRETLAAHCDAAIASALDREVTS